MKKTLVLFLIALLSCSIPPDKTTSIPDYLSGTFEDDYGITYSISDSLFAMGDHTRIHIEEWNFEEQFFVGQNDSSNTYDPLLYSRVDWMKFENMNEFEWGFCMSAYNEPTLDSARVINTVNRETPRTGCNGYPFSRMKRVTN